MNAYARFACPLACLTLFAGGCTADPSEAEETLVAEVTASNTVYRGAVEAAGETYTIEVALDFGELEQTKRCHGGRFLQGFVDLEEVAGHSVTARVRDASGKVLGEATRGFDVADLGSNIPNTHCTARFTRLADRNPIRQLGERSFVVSVPGVVVETPSGPIAINGKVSQPFSAEVELTGTARFEATTTPAYATFSDSEKLVVRGDLAFDLQGEIVVTVGRGAPVPSTWSGAPSTSSELVPVTLTRR